MGKQGFAEAAKNPTYPKFDATEPHAVQSYLSDRNLLLPGEHVVRLEKVPYPTRNETLRVVTNERAWFLKHFLVWPDNGVVAPAQRDRFHAESLFHRAARISRCDREPLPTLVHQDANEQCLVFEDAGPEVDGGAVLTESEVEALAWFLINVHHHSQSVPVCARHCSEGIRRWHAARLFPAGLAARRGRDYRWRQRLFGEDVEVVSVLERSREALIDGGANLVHGDFVPGNWVRTTAGLRVVDAEFSFFGRPEFDVGAFLAGLALLDLPRVVQARAHEVLAQACVRYDPGMVAAFLAVHLCSMLDGGAAGVRAPSGSQALALYRRAVAAIRQRDPSLTLPRG